MATATDGSDADVPTLPPGRRVTLPGRGTTFVRELGGPDGAPTVLLLHGWTVTADLNFYLCYGALARHFRVVALDHRGHGKGMRVRSRRAFRLTDCADDAAALLAVLGIERAIVVGYSMGGAVAQLMWRRHPKRVAGLVLAATAASFAGSAREEWLWWAGLQWIVLTSRVTPGATAQWLGAQFNARRGKRYQQWAAAQVDNHQWRAVFEAGRDVSRFSSAAWIGAVDVPTAVVMTGRDQAVKVRRQEALAAAITGATAYPVDAGHDACVARAAVFVPALVAACQDVAGRIASSPAPDPGPEPQPSSLM